MAAVRSSLDLDPAIVPETGVTEAGSSNQLTNTSFLYDDCYSSLRDHFCMDGRGRRPSLPTIPIPTHRILAQMSLLKDAENRTWDEMTGWFLKLFPGSSFTRGKLEYRCKVALKKIANLTGDKLQKFLDTVVALDVESDTLTQLGLTRDILLGKRDGFQGDVDKGCFNNKLVVEIDKFRVKERQAANFTTKWLTFLLVKQDDSILELRVRHKVSQVLVQHKKLNLKKDNLDVMNTFLRESFLLPVSKPVAERSEKSSKPSPLKSVHNKVIKQFESNLQKANIELENLHCENTCIKEERDALRKKKHNPSVSCNKSVQTKDKSNLQISALKKDLLEQSQLHQTVVKKNNILKQINERNEVEIASLKQQIKTEQTLKSKYKKQYEETLMISEAILDSEDIVKTEESVTLKNKTKNSFTDAVHLTYMALQGEGNVAASNCSTVINIVSKYLYQKEIPMEDLPCTQSALNMSSEGHYLSKKQTVESVLNSSHFTLATDGTSRQKRHYIERHIVLPNGKSMSLGFTEIASDNAETLLEKTVELVHELTETYSEDEEEKQRVFKDVFGKMVCLMSDRAAVMKLFDKKLAAYKNEIIGEDASTHFLFCNAHVLLGLSSAAEDASKEIEKEIKENDIGQVFGRDKDAKFSIFGGSGETIPGRVIRAAADIFGPRGDEKNGCRNQWLVYLDSIGVKSKFTSYRSNRFNSLFQNAFALTFHRKHVIKFLEDLATHSNLKTQSVLEDVKDDNVMAMVAAYSHFNYCFSSPYWQLMNSDKPHGVFPTYVKKMEAFLKKTGLDDKPVFPDFAKDDLYLDSFKQNEMFKKTFDRICFKCLIVLKRQLSDFVDDGIFAGDIAEGVHQILMTTPLTNLTGERLFGDLDFDIMKRRNASTHLRSSINMWKHNKTGHWISKKSSDTAAYLLKKARQHGIKMLKRSKEDERDVRLKVREILREKERLKNEKELADKEKHLQIITDVVNQGGICNTKEDLEKIMKGKKTLENLKAQIRYRKFVMHEKHLNVSGNITQLYNSLLAHLGYSSEDVYLPPVKKYRTE